MTYFIPYAIRHQQHIKFEFKERGNIYYLIEKFGVEELRKTIYNELRKRIDPKHSVLIEVYYNTAGGDSFGYTKIFNEYRDSFHPEQLFERLLHLEENGFETVRSGHLSFTLTIKQA